MGLEPVVEKVAEASFPVSLRPSGKTHWTLGGSPSGSMTSTCRRVDWPAVTGDGFALAAVTLGTALAIVTCAVATGPLVPSLGVATTFQVCPRNRCSAGTSRSVNWVWRAPLRLHS